MAMEAIDKCGYIVASSYRYKTLLELSNKKYETPTNLAHNTGIKVNHISKILRELKEKEMIKCVNENVRKGRLYCITDEGKAVMKLVQEISL